MGAPQKSKPLDEVTGPDGAYDVSALERKLEEIDTAIIRARSRQDAAVDAGDHRTVVLEEAVIQRRLAERRDVTS